MPIATLRAGRLPVSAIIACYRCSDTIRRAVRSIAEQTTPPYEIILVDDCSEDATPETLHQIASEYPPGWIKILELTVNGGAGQARNAGWNAAVQPYVAFLDADDAWHAKKLEIQYGWMQNHTEVQLTGHSTAWIRDGKVPTTSARLARVAHISRDRLLLGNCFSLRSVMVKREFPIRFHPKKRYMEDYWWMLQTAFSGYDVYRIELPLAYIFKAPYGAGGLSGRQWEMEKSELDNYWGLKRDGKLGFTMASALTIYSLVKYAKRVTVATCLRRAPLAVRARQETGRSMK